MPSRPALPPVLTISVRQEVRHKFQFLYEWAGILEIRSLGSNLHLGLQHSQAAALWQSEQAEKYPSSPWKSHRFGVVIIKWLSRIMTNSLFDTETWEDSQVMLFLFLGTAGRRGGGGRLADSRTSV